MISAHRDRGANWPRNRAIFCATNPVGMLGCAATPDLRFVAHVDRLHAGIE